MDALKLVMTPFGLRFKTIIDVETKEPLLELEHETRACAHFQFMKPVEYHGR